MFKSLQVFTGKLPTMKWALETPHETLNRNCPFPHTAINRSPSKALPTPLHILQKNGYFISCQHHLTTTYMRYSHRNSWLSIGRRPGLRTKDKMFHLVLLELELYDSFNFPRAMHTFIPQPSKWQHTTIYLYTNCNLIIPNRVNFYSYQAIETITVQVPSLLQSLDNQEFKGTTWKTKHSTGGLVISENLHMVFIFRNKLIFL